LAPPAASKKRESEKVPSQVQDAKESKSLKSVAAADGISLGHIDLMVAQLNKGIFGKMGNCNMIEKVYVPNVVRKTPSPSYGVSVAPGQYATYVTQNIAGHGSQIPFYIAARFRNVEFVPQVVGGMLCMVAKDSRLSSEEMRCVLTNMGYSQNMFCEYPQGGDLAFNLKDSFVMISGFDGQISSSTQVGWLSMTVSPLLNNSVWKV
jgi:hypothetical protein